MYHPVVWYCVATFAVNTVGDKGVFIQVSTLLDVVFSAHGEPNMSTTLNFTNKPVEHYQLFPLYVQLALPLTDKTNFSYHFLIEFAVDRYLQNFLLNSH
jgi:hypothetical protein